LINSGNFDAITALCKDAVAKALGFTVVHVGINEESEDAALKAAKMFEAIFGFAVKPGSSSIFSSDKIEITKSKFPGKHGHIAVGVVGSVERAVYHLERQGFLFDKSTEKRDAKGGLIAVYLKDEIAGFAIHLVVKK